MEKIINNITGKYNQIYNTNYDSDNFNVSIFKILLNLSKEDILKIGINKSKKEIEKKLIEQLGYINFLNKNFIKKFNFNKNNCNLENLILENNLSIKNKKKFDNILTYYSLNDVIDNIILIKYSYINELEKFFKRKIGNTKDRLKRQEQIKNFDISYHFGNNITEIEFNKKALLYFFACFHNNNFKILQLNEKKFLWRIYKILLNKYNINRLELKKEFSEIKKIQYDKILDKKIKIEDAIKYFEIFIKNTPIQIKIRTSKNFTNFSASFGKFKIPTGKNFKTITIKQFITLIAHEIETHNYCFANTIKATNKKITLSGNNIRDEGLAKINELLLFGQLNDKSLPNHNLLRLFIGKEFKGKTYLYFLKLLEKIDNEASGFEKRFLRYKKFYSFDLKGTFSKDIVYDVGENLTKKYFNNLKNEKSIIHYIANGFLRVGFEQIKLSELYLINILKENNVNIDSNIEILKFLDKAGYSYRSFYSDYIYYMIINSEYDENDFRKKMQTNYDFLANDVIEYFINKIPKDNLKELALKLTS